MCKGGAGDERHLQSTVGPAVASLQLGRVSKLDLALTSLQEMSGWRPAEMARPLISVLFLIS